MRCPVLVVVFAILALAASTALGQEVTLASSATLDFQFAQWRADGLWVLFDVTDPTTLNFHEIRKVDRNGSPAGGWVLVSDPEKHHSW